MDHKISPTQVHHRAHTIPNTYKGVLSKLESLAMKDEIVISVVAADTLHGFNSACTACYHRRLLTLQVWVPEGGWCPRHMMKPSRTEVL